MRTVEVNTGYELYQIITDFEHPLEIFREGIQNAFDADATKIYVKVSRKEKLGRTQIVIDMLNNGEGLSKDKIANFFDVANSTKVDKEYVSTGKHGYKGHGTKVFFNAHEILICSKTKEGEYWAASMKDPVSQIENNHRLEYCEPEDPDNFDIELPLDWKQGFRVRIIEPKIFATVENQAQLDHRCLRDYCKWYSMIGTVETLYNDDLREKGILFYISGLNYEVFKGKYRSTIECDPVPEFETTNWGEEYEKIPLGHYFPPNRDDNKKMENYATSIGATGKPSYKYYSKMIFNDTIEAGALSFRLIISLEGEETEKKYDLMMTRKGRTRITTEHTAGQRYGLWACKGGVPVEKIDDWIESGKGIGSYTYLHAFIDCDQFKLTANRGSIKNTEIDKLNTIRDKFNEIFSNPKIKRALEERQEWENLEKTIQSVESDNKSLKDRYKNAKKRKLIILPDGTNLLEPRKIKTGYSEAETFALLIQLMTKYPDLFDFKLLDYDTNVGMDFVVEDNVGNPRYIELKGELIKQVNHPFSLIHKFICYDTSIGSGEILSDKEELEMQMDIRKNTSFISNNSEFNGKKYTFYNIIPTNSRPTSIEVICLKRILLEVIGASIE